MARRIRATTHADKVAAAIEAMTPDHVTCRDYGHAWVALWATYDEPSRTYDTAARCSRCATVRQRWLTSTGGQLASRYTYPENYLANGVGRLTTTDRDRIRLAHITDLLAGAEGKEATA